jgi:uncharacterized membrane protein YccC
MARSLAGLLPSAAEIRTAAVEWSRSEGAVWIYVAKTVIAALLTLWLAMRLQLPQPSTATTTVFVVMQPQSGQVFAKGFYRILGSIVGLTVVLMLVALFGQGRVLFLLSSALWIGLCTAGAARYRDFRSYACMLAGYTTALIGLPAAVNPEGVFMQAMWRFEEIVLGITCAALVSAVIFPQRSVHVLREAVYKRFGAFAAFALEHLHGRQRPQFEMAELRFAQQAVALEALRSASSFDDPLTRLRSGRLARLNIEFMTLSTRYHALHQLLERLRDQQALVMLDALEPCLAHLCAILEAWRDKRMEPSDATLLATELEARRTPLMDTIRDARTALAGNDAALLDFDTAAELLYRLMSDVHDYVQTHASLTAPRHERESWKYAFEAKANPIAALVAGLRSALMLLVAGIFWIETSWPSGSRFALMTAVVATILSTAPNPSRTAVQMVLGTLLASVFGLAVTFLVLPHIEGFALLSLTFAPAFALGTYMSVKPKVAGVGSGFRLYVSVGAIPANLAVFDAAGMINTYIALVLAQALAAVATLVVMPPNAPWLWRHLERDLRRSVIRMVQRRKSAGLAATFESATRDLLIQGYNLAASRPDVQKRLLSWFFVVQEIGHAVIELRRELDALPAEPWYARNTPWRSATDELGRGLIRLFAEPDSSRLERALKAAEDAIATAHATEEPRPAHFESSPLRRIESYLHFIRTTLLEMRPLLASIEDPAPK